MILLFILGAKVLQTVQTLGLETRLHKPQRQSGHGSNIMDSEAHIQPHNE